MNPHFAEWIAQARMWKELIAEDAGAMFYYNETTKASLWEAPTGQGYTRVDTRLVLQDGTVMDDPAISSSLELLQQHK